MTNVELKELQKVILEIALDFDVFYSDFSSFLHLEN